MDVHQTLINLAGKERSGSMGAANYHYITRLPDKSRIEKHYSTTVLPVLKKHKFPDTFSDKMHIVQKEILNNWRKEKRID